MLRRTLEEGLGPRRLAKPLENLPAIIVTASAAATAAT
jgi:hypothetical protein